MGSNPCSQDPESVGKAETRRAERIKRKAAVRQHPILWNAASPWTEGPTHTAPRPFRPKRITGPFYEEPSDSEHPRWAGRFGELVTFPAVTESSRRHAASFRYRERSAGTFSCNAHSSNVTALSLVEIHVIMNQSPCFLHLFSFSMSQFSPSVLRSLHLPPPPSTSLHLPPPPSTSLHLPPFVASGRIQHQLTV
ncbi:hypothetical protein EYF80_050599 [Liparis tanakae]|uniref:Uncharacterized protein n=1 Tax=Liparis tanakae TaxID=230148 RepID=A0A4Z2FE32_9TELE|nr:hypothetical protein EYF80_050599 [Liparis tanakae]